jgi:hypothetical protein
MQKFDFDKVELIMKAGKLKRELSPGLDIASLYVSGYEHAVQACSEHYEDQNKQQLAAIDAEIKIVKKHELEAKKLHNMQGMSSHLDKLEHILKGLQKARDIIAGEGE